MSQNTFDFYTIGVMADAITPLKQAGIPRSSISSERNGYKHYGSWPNIKSYPKYVYRATVKFIDVPGTTKEDVDRAEAEVKKAYPGLTVYIHYHARD